MSDENQAQPTPQVVHFTRSVDPVKPVISPEVALKHQRSQEMYPSLNLSDGEYVLYDVPRHIMGLAAPFAVGGLLITMALSFLFLSDLLAPVLNVAPSALSFSAVVLPVLLFIILIGLGVYVAYYIFLHNRFFLTNESVIQEIQHSLFSRHEQTVSLANIEDASFEQHGILQHLFGYGSIRLSTQGDETTYRFNYVIEPKKYVAALNNAVEAFKNGRPIEDKND